MAILIYIAILLALAVFGLDRYLDLKDLEKDLKLLLGDFLVARDLSDGQVKVHYQATVSALKTLIRGHFKD